MKQIRTFDNMFVTMGSIVLLLILTGCGTSYTIKHPLETTNFKTGVYRLGSCDMQDKRSTVGLANALQSQIQYGLMKEGLYEKNEDKASLTVNLTVTYYRNTTGQMRALIGVLAGKDGLDVVVEVVDRQSGDIVGNATASHYNITAVDYTEKMMVYEVTKKIVEFLASGGKDKPK